MEKGIRIPKAPEKSARIPAKATSNGERFPLPLKWRRAELSDKKKELFFSELGIMLTSGVDLHAALRIVSADFRQKRDNAIFTALVEGLVSGQNFSDALQRTNAFSKLDVSVIRIGESTGRLADVFRFLADYYNRKVKQRALVLNAISYPLFVLAFALLAVGFLLNSVVPLFSSVYKRFGGDLPGITRVVVGISDSMWIISLALFVLVLCIAIAAYLYRTNSRVNNTISVILLRIPLVRDILVVNFLERFCRVMSMLTNSRIPLTESISLSKETVALQPYQKALGEVELDLYSGIPFWKALERTGQFSQRIVYLVRMGEEVNRLETVFENLTLQYSVIQEKRLKNLGTYLEPALIVIVGIMVGFILVAVYLPMFKLGDKFF